MTLPIIHPEQRIAELQAVIYQHCADITRLQRSNAKLKERIAELEEALREVTSKMDCDRSPHMADTCPRCCAVQALKGGAK